VRLLFAIKSLNVAGGGAERVLTQVVSALADRGHEVAVVTFDAPGRSFYPMADSVRRIDLAASAAGESTPRGQLVAVLPRLRQVVKSERPDVVIGFMHSMYLPLGIAMLGTRVPLIASEHVGIDHYWTVPVQRALLELTPWLSVASTIPSDRVRSGFQRRLRRRMVTMVNPVAEPGATTVEGRAESSEQVILAVGRLFAEKNHNELVEAFATIADTYPTWKLRIVGEGELRTELEHQVGLHGLTDRVELPGAVQDVGSEYARAAIVAVPSRYESFGLSTAEALAAMRPVIGFADCPGTNELIHHERNGLLVAGSGDRVAALATGLGRLMADAALRDRLAAAGPASVESFRTDSVADRWEQLLVRCATIRC
jgi:GalNAc-alpha-(1->4)-GalNAc-alpha-(1->3)-diNAcBac-PP-undecaprenol alpha-1,4-N-acetyl-D-galactosaminyltransferase